MNLQPGAYFVKGQGLKKYDSRVKRLKSDPRFILINNYKCGFSSSNLLPYEIVKEISPEDEVIYFYRHIFLRAISVFINWCITDDRFANQEGWLLANLEAELGPASYQHFLDLLIMERHSEAFQMYVESLEAIAARNDHTLPQVTVLEYYRIDRIDHFVELENHSRFRQITNIAFPYDRKNASDETIKRSLLRYLISNEASQDILRRVYRKDTVFFRNNDLECADCRSFA